MPQPLTWSYAVMTCSQRRAYLLPQTLASLKRAGFDQPHLFVDGDNDSKSWATEFGLNVTCRYPNVKTAGNWVLSMYELYYRNPAANRYALFQDDLVTYINLKSYLESCPYPDKGYLNLYLFDSNLHLCPQDKNKNPINGWFEANQLGRGAVGLVFNRDALQVLLSANHLVGRVAHPHRGHKAIDGGIVESMKIAGWKEYVHYPSLTQHMGHVSSMGHQPHKQAESFLGEGFDALQLLASKAPQPRVAPKAVRPVPTKPPLQKSAEVVTPRTFKFGDNLEQALTKVGITKDRVSKWIGGPCGCEERREKMNQLGTWLHRILSGKEDTSKAKEQLESLMESQ